MVALVRTREHDSLLFPTCGFRRRAHHGRAGIRLRFSPPWSRLPRVPASEAADAGSLLGTKTILNEFIAYLKLAALPEGAAAPRSRLIMLYAMCGFADLGSSAS